MTVNERNTDVTLLASAKTF